MQKTVFLVIGIALLFTASAMAEMQCAVMPPALCPETGVKVIGLTSQMIDGSHASIPSDQMNALVVCCSGIEGLSVDYANEGADIYLYSARDSHASRVSGENGLKITGVSCGYFNDCTGYDSCVFSISDDTDAHIGDCGNYAFERKLCYREGALLGEQLAIGPPAAGPESYAEPVVQEQRPQRMSLLARLRMRLAELGRRL